MGKFKDTLKSLYYMNGSAATLTKKSTKEFLQAMVEPAGSNRYVSSVSPGAMVPGKFYFVFYDLSGKSTKMEQYSPILMCDRFNIKTKSYFWGVNLNFIPSAVRVIFVDALLGRNQNIVDANADATSLKDESPLNGTGYAQVNKALMSVGFEYCIRQFDASLVQRVWEVSTSYMHTFITLNTESFTGVDEAALVKIWAAKIKDQEERQREVAKRLLDNYNEMSEIIESELADAAGSVDRLHKAAQHIKKIDKRNK